MPWEIIKPGTHIDFVGRRRIAGAISAAVLLASAVAIAVNGVQLGIDFAGGTEVQVQFAPGVNASDGALRAVLTDTLEISEPSVVRYGDPEANEFLLRFASNINEDVAPAAGTEDSDVAGSDLIVKLEQALRGAIGELTVERVEFVGPRVGAELRNDGLKALLYASLAILVYIAFRFNTRFAPGAIVAVIHDLSITAGIFVILGMEFDLRILAAMLAILGYSLNDTIIIYDRVRENMALHTTVDLPEVLNQSINQTLSRTVLTSATTLVALLSLYILGGEVIRPFAFAMIIGVFVGTYSSVFIAAPVLLFLERRYGGGGAAEAAAAERRERERAKQGEDPQGGSGKGGQQRTAPAGKRRGKAGGKAARRAT